MKNNTPHVEKQHLKQNICRPATPISPKLYMDIWPKSRQIDRYMIKLAKICINLMILCCWEQSLLLWETDFHLLC